MCGWSWGESDVSNTIDSVKKDSLLIEIYESDKSTREIDKK